MKICLIAPIEEKVPPKLHGGIERSVYFLTEGLVKKGHQVSLLATKDSQTSARLFPIIPHSLRSNIVFKDEKKNTKAREAYYQMAIANILKILMTKKFDLIHNHFGWKLIPFSQLLSTPFITTLQTPLDQINKQIVLSHYKKIPLITVSNNQRKSFPGLNYIATVYIGTDISLYDFSKSHKNYLVFLGRTSPEKGTLEAIQIAKKLNKRLIMAAATHSWDLEYFKSKIKPNIDNKQIVFLGEIDDIQKNQLLKGAQALLAPIQWDEPFGTMFIEAMACGTPVITLNRGSAGEVVIDGLTGIVAKSTDDICKRFKEIEKISRINCRHRVENFFSSLTMVDNYEKLYLNYLNNYKKI